MANFHFELVSPEKMLFSGDVQSVIVPGSDGEFQVFAGHAPVMSTLHAGVLRVEGASGAARRIFVAGGFADVNDSGLTSRSDSLSPTCSPQPPAVRHHRSSPQGHRSWTADVRLISVLGILRVPGDDPEAPNSTVTPSWPPRNVIGTPRSTP